MKTGNFSTHPILFPWIISVVCFFAAPINGRSDSSMSTASVAPEISARIVNGGAASEGEFPWMGHLWSITGGPVQGLFCGATLLGPQLALTAAHCALEFTSHPFALSATFGNLRLTSSLNARTSAVDGVSIHPGYDADTSRNDLALVHLQQPLSGPYVSLIGEEEDHLWDPGLQALLIGWGTMDEVNPAQPDLLQKASVGIFSDADCEARYGLPYDPHSMVCAGKLASSPTSGDGIDSCYGDSGGPLLVSDGVGGLKQIGITSWGFSCASHRYPGVYARIAPFLKWIQSVPDTTPFPLASPSVAGELEVGKTVVCSGAVFGGSKLSVRYTWSSNRGVIYHSTDPTYRLRRSDQGRFLNCTVTAKNRSGSARLSTEVVGPVERAKALIHAPEHERPESEHTASLSLNVQLESVQCRTQACMVTLRTNNNSGSAKASSVTVSMERAIETSCQSPVSMSGTGGQRSVQRSVPCTKWTAKSLRALPFSVHERSRWRVTLGRSNHAAIYKLSVTARNRLGQKQRTPTRLNIAIPAR